MSDLRFETIEAAIALARKLEVAAASLRVVQAHPTFVSLNAAVAPMGAIFDVLPTYMAAANGELQRALLAAAVPTVAQ